MTAISLFDLAQQVRESVNQIDPDTGEIVEAYSENRALFEQKAVACVAYAKEEAATLDSAKALIKEMQAKIDARELRLGKFKAYMADCMKATGITEVKHDLGLFAAKLYIDRDESVELDDSTTFPAALCNEPKPPTPSKTKIKAAIKAGEAVAGARIVRKDRLAIS
jgi:Siphovirus Gp157.